MARRGEASEARQGNREEEKRKERTMKKKGQRGKECEIETKESERWEAI